MTLNIPADDYGNVYLFLLPEGPDPDVAAMLGVEFLDLAHVDVIQVKDLQGLGLRGYLVSGMGISEDQIGPEANRDSGMVALLRSAAFSGRRAEVIPAPGVRHLATYVERRAETPERELRSVSAGGIVSGKPVPSQGAILGKVAMIALLVIFALTALMVWIA